LRLYIGQKAGDLNLRDLKLIPIEIAGWCLDTPVLMGTLGGFPNPPALWLRRAKPGFAYAIMGSLGGFPNPPALWLRRAKPGFAYAIMGSLGGFASPLGVTAADEANPWSRAS
jgi:hypothetical protein